MLGSLSLVSFAASFSYVSKIAEIQYSDSYSLQAFELKMIKSIKYG